MSPSAGTLHIVATPIGNLGDMTPRGLEVLGAVDVVAAEDTRHSGRLLAHFGVRACDLLSLHEHNEDERVEVIIRRLLGGESVALISDAGTPLVSDPGYQLVRRAHREGIRVIPVPGASSPVAALSVSGLPTDRFCFEGFLSARSGPRARQLEGLAGEARTLVFLESSHRIEATLEAMVAALGGERQAVMARELTKAYETVRASSLADLLTLVRDDPDQRRGEFVLVVAGAPPTTVNDAERDRVLGVLLAELPVKQAAALGARILGLPRNACYQRLLELQRD
ncbi:16S rRNA (cytidine(1402)-2'-O)-methyltransferase [Aquisalimonas sp. 2447]|uniref:16S rRNA (cytidine(1402)-2'-O)-methyltransferase n=1 Tax=Aquisalimonas sp. 2447 TaxID=2740807 RepID=UPI00143254CF|nr:16S rRNA (cytidine(1402)-2'-O)-methyltransferase [Aquisalimonas sp. 2447]QIT56287.1 16S rRNA (cytidine(1402)-2'-O)-methyltransferase [Aquisalimonas sp. 2447]